MVEFKNILSTKKFDANVDTFIKFKNSDNYKLKVSYNGHFYLVNKNQSRVLQFFIRFFNELFYIRVPTREKIAPAFKRLALTEENKSLKKIESIKTSILKHKNDYSRTKKQKEEVKNKLEALQSKDPKNKNIKHLKEKYDLLNQIQAEHKKHLILDKKQATQALEAHEVLSQFVIKIGKNLNKKRLKNHPKIQNSIKSISKKSKESIKQTNKIKTNLKNLKLSKNNYTKNSERITSILEKVKTK